MPGGWEGTELWRAAAPTQTRKCKGENTSLNPVITREMHTRAACAHTDPETRRCADRHTQPHRHIHMAAHLCIHGHVHTHMHKLTPLHSTSEGAIVPASCGERLSAVAGLPGGFLSQRRDLSDHGKYNPQAPTTVKGRRSPWFS